MIGGDIFMRRGKSPGRERPTSASSTPSSAPLAPAAAVVSTLDPHAVAGVLLQLGTTPFVAALLALGPVSVASDVARLLSCLLSYSSIILAYIGGLQQAAAVSGADGPPRRASLAPLVVGAILLALGGWVVLALSQLHGVAPSHLLVASCLYSGQACLERRMPVPERVLMREARRVPMVVAAACLAGAAPAAASVAPFVRGRASTRLGDSRADSALLVLSCALLLAALAPRRSSSGRPTHFARVAVGSQNACKCEAVRQTLEAYPALAPPTDKLPLLTFSVPSGVSEQPIGLPTIARGARNRAAAAHAAAVEGVSGGISGGGVSGGGGGGVLALGIESGLFEVDGAHYDACWVSAFDGATHHLGLSCAFEIPRAILAHVERGLDLSQACHAAGITADCRLGEGVGLIGILSRGRIRRLEYTVHAVQTALFFAENAGWFP